MKSLRKQRRIQIVSVAIVALAVSVGLIGYALKGSINYYRSPTEVLSAPPQPTEVFRLGGLVEGGSLVRGESEVATFSITDGNAVIPASFKGVLPDLFDENQGMIGTGTYQDGVFVATKILAKHDETYMPKEVIDTLKAQGIYQAPDGS